MGRNLLKKILFPSEYVSQRKEVLVNALMWLKDTIWELSFQYSE